jgi:hypothetical protein
MWTIQRRRAERAAGLQREADGEGLGDTLTGGLERDGNGVATGAESAVDRAAGSGGAALPAALQGKFEQSLGADLGDVRVHTGEASQDAAAAVGAKAYTVGNDIHFGEGQYDPASAGGEELLAHEVAHTVQQSSGAVARRPQFKLAVSTPGDAHEVEADGMAAAMVSGESAAVGGTSGPPELDLTFTELSLPIGTDIELLKQKMSFITVDVKASAAFKGKIGVTPGVKASQERAAVELKGQWVQWHENGEPVHLVDSGINFSELSFAKFTKNQKKGSIGGFKLYDGEVKKGASSLGKLGLSVAAFDYDLTKPEDPSFKFLKVEASGEMTYAQVKTTIPCGAGKEVIDGKLVGGLKASAAIDLVSVAKILAGELVGGGLASMAYALPIAIVAYTCDLVWDDISDFMKFADADDNIADLSGQFAAGFGAGVRLGMDGSDTIGDGPGAKEYAAGCVAGKAQRHDMMKAFAAANPDAQKSDDEMDLAFQDALGGQPIRDLCARAREVRKVALQQTVFSQAAGSMTKRDAYPARMFCKWFIPPYTDPGDRAGCIVALKNLGPEHAELWNAIPLDLRDKFMEQIGPGLSYPEFHIGKPIETLPEIAKRPKVQAAMKWLEEPTHTGTAIGGHAYNRWLGSDSRERLDPVDEVRWVNEKLGREETAPEEVVITTRA